MRIKSAALRSLSRSFPLDMYVTWVSVLQEICCGNLHKSSAVDGTNGCMNIDVQQKYNLDNKHKILMTCLLVCVLDCGIFFDFNHVTRRPCWS